VPVIADTAYPRLSAEPMTSELEAFTPEAAELAFARGRTRQPGPRLALLVLLKAFQRLGYAVRLTDVPAAFAFHVAASAGLTSAVPEIAGYDDTTYRVRLLALVRSFVGVAGYDREARGMAARACVEAARTRDDLADIVNAGIEELLRCRRELPAFGTLLKLARNARALVNRAYYRRIAASLSHEACECLAALLMVPEGATRSGWDQVKAAPPRPSPQRMRETVLACQNREAERDTRLTAVEHLLLPDADATLAKCEAHAAFAGNNYLPLLTRFYGGQRSAFLRFLAHTIPVSTSQDRATEQAIAFLLAHRTDRKAKLRAMVDAPAADGTTIHRPLDLSWVGEKWWPLLTGRTARDPAPAEVDRRYFEICLFTQVVNELKSGDLSIQGSEEYGDYRDQLVSWEEYERDVAGYAEQAGVPADPGAFVAALKAHLAATAASTDRALPDNEHVEIVDGQPTIRRLRARDGDDGTAFLERLLKLRMVPAGVLEALADTEHWLGWTRHFGPVSGFEAKLDRPRERYLATTFCYGCGLGPSQAARSLKGLDRRHVAFANQRHITEENLDDAITGVITPTPASVYTGIGAPAIRPRPTA